MSLIICTVCGFEMLVPHRIQQTNYLGICGACLKDSSENKNNYNDIWDENTCQNIEQLRMKLSYIQYVNLQGKLYSHLTLVMAPQLIPKLQQLQFNRNNSQYKNPNIQPLIYTSKQKTPVFHQTATKVMSNLYLSTPVRPIKNDYELERYIMMADQVLNEPLNCDYHLNKERQKLKSNPFHARQIVDIQELSQYSQSFDRASTIMPK